MTCRNCGQVIQMMCQMGSGFCCLQCHDDYAANVETVRRATGGMYKDIKVKRWGGAHAF